MQENPTIKEKDNEIDMDEIIKREKKKDGIINSCSGSNEIIFIPPNGSRRRPRPNSTSSSSSSSSHGTTTVPVPSTTCSMLQQLTLQLVQTYATTTVATTNSTTPNHEEEIEEPTATTTGLEKTTSTNQETSRTNTKDTSTTSLYHSKGRILTKKSISFGNDGLDNEDHNLIVSVRDLFIGGNERYIVLDLLGQGTFGQVFRCQNEKTKELVAIKVIRNHPSYYKQALVEIQLTYQLNQQFPKEKSPHLVQIHDAFMHQNHLCLVFELLSLNLYEVIAQNNFQGFPLNVTRGFIEQILLALTQLEQAHVIHSDLKPENILLVGPNQLFQQTIQDSNTGPSRLQSIPLIKIVDFGSACFEHETVFSYIQSRFYRSPEVLLGVPYTRAIDLWSLGCIAIEMFLGLPLFPGVSEHDQIRLIMNTLGPFPVYLLQNGRHVNQFFHRLYTEHKHEEFILKTPEEFAKENGLDSVKKVKKYFKYSKLSEMIHAYPYDPSLIEEQREMEQKQRQEFIEFVQGLLSLDPQTRWTAKQALTHSFIRNNRPITTSSTTSSKVAPCLGIKTTPAPTPTILREVTSTSVVDLPPLPPGPPPSSSPVLPGPASVSRMTFTAGIQNGTSRPMTRRKVPICHQRSSQLPLTHGPPPLPLPLPLPPPHHQHQYQQQYHSHHHHQHPRQMSTSSYWTVEKSKYITVPYESDPATTTTRVHPSSNSTTTNGWSESILKSSDLIKTHRHYEFYSHHKLKGNRPSGSYVPVWYGSHHATPVAPVVGVSMYSLANQDHPHIQYRYPNQQPQQSHHYLTSKRHVQGRRASGRGNWSSKSQGKNCKSSLPSEQVT